jgi:hypothetical protein
MAQVDWCSIRVIQRGIFIRDKIESEIAKGRDGSTKKSHCTCSDPVSREELIDAKGTASVNKKCLEVSKEVNQRRFAVGELHDGAESSKGANFTSKESLIV